MGAGGFDLDTEQLLDLLSGRVLGPYELRERLGAGGMGVVYRAMHQRLNQERAVKVLPVQLAADPVFITRFEREARLAAELRHPNIVIIHDIGEDRGIHYIAMELLEGRSLRQLILEDGALPLDRAVGLLRQLASALDFAHRRGVAHRDVKPGNVFVGLSGHEESSPGTGSSEHVTLVDFGIARAAEESRLTGTGGLVGTAEYMAPEVVLGAENGPGTDLYALGIVAYELLTRRVPFTGTNSNAIMYAHVNTPPPPPRTLRPRLPGGGGAGDPASAQQAAGGAISNGNGVRGGAPGGSRAAVAESVAIPAAASAEARSPSAPVAVTSTRTAAPAVPETVPGADNAA